VIFITVVLYTIDIARFLDQFSLVTSIRMRIIADPVGHD